MTTPSPTPTKSMDDIMALCKRRGFVYQASEIYGGIQGFWDYGPLGAQLKKNLRDAWWQDVVMNPCRGLTGPDGNPVRIVPVDTCIIQNPKVWEASGHVGGFNDPMVDCRECKSRFRADHLIAGKAWSWGDDFPAESDVLDKAISQTSSPADFVAWCLSGDSQSEIERRVKKQRKARKVEFRVLEAPIQMPFIKVDGRVYRWGAVEGEPLGPDTPCPECGSIGTLTEPRAFNLMFDTYPGPIRDEANKAYLRPETAQGIFINFKNVIDTTRVRVPFGIAQTGKAFRNEVTPRNFTFRSREFEQMEVEFFCHKDDANGWYAFWRDWRMAWWKELGLAGENLILREHDRDELAHYAKEGAGTSDVEYRFPFTAPGFGELEGIAHRSNYDLSAHQKHPASTTKLEYFDQERNERYLPDVIEPSAGLDRGVLAALCEAYTPDENRPSKVFMKFHPRLAPIKAAVFPLVNKDGMPEVGEKLAAALRQRFGHLGTIEFDAKQNIGKRYARMDEAGCPFCFTVDGDTLTDQTVTVRERDTLAQERVSLDRAPGYVAEKLGLE